MNMVLTLLVLLGLPVLIKKFDKTKLVSFFSPIALAYAAGIGVTFLPFQKFSLELNMGVVQELSEVSIALSISLLVLDSRFDKFRQVLKPILKAFLLGIVSLLIISFAAFFLIAKNMNFGSDILGMLTGVYVGGTPNLNAIGIALGVDPETLALVNTAEVFFGGIYFLLLITVIKPFLSLFLRKYSVKNIEVEGVLYDDPTEWKAKLKNILLGLLAAVIALGASFGIAIFIRGKVDVAFFLITLTTISIAMAQMKAVKSIKMKYITADFLLLVFSLGIGLQIDLSQLFTQGLEIYALCAFVFFGTILTHYFLAYITGTDTDTLMISSTAALYGPAFIVPIAKAIGNRELIIYGITLGLLGYILGNYLGIGLAYLFGYMA